MNSNEFYGREVTINEPVIHVDDTPEDIEFDKAFRETLSEIHKIIFGFVENQENV
jgi:hypothetical protein